MAAADDLRERVRVLEALRASDREALALQAAEYDRRLGELNHAHERAEEVRHTVVTTEKFDTVRAGDAKALTLALQRADEKIAGLGGRVVVLETWRAKATGVGAVLVLFSSLIGAAVATALGG